MRWNPVLNALAASAYIGTIVLFLHFIESVRRDTPDTILDGLGLILLFVFSAAVMAFLFFNQPVSLLIEERKNEAAAYFLKTLSIFGLITAVVLMLVSIQ